VGIVEELVKIWPNEVCDRIDVNETLSSVGRMVSSEGKVVLEFSS